jgi:hypothetical protein
MIARSDHVAARSTFIGAVSGGQQGHGVLGWFAALALVSLAVGPARTSMTESVVLRAVRCLQIVSRCSQVWICRRGAAVKSR